jgi:hypothetical protein
MIYIYDSDKVQRNQQSKLLNAILSSGKRINVLSAPAGAGKSTKAKKMGNDFITDISQIPNAKEFWILSAAASSKKPVAGEITKAMKKLIDASKRTGGQLQYLVVPSLEIMRRKKQRGRSGKSDDLRTPQQLKRTFWADLNDYPFIDKLKKHGFKLVKESYLYEMAIPKSTMYAVVKRDKKGKSQGKIVFKGSKSLCMKEFKKLKKQEPDMYYLKNAPTAKVGDKVKESGETVTEMKKDELKNLIKGCVVEVLSEGETDKRLGHIDDAYKKRSAQISKLTSELNKKLKTHKSDFYKMREKGGTDWGYVGDLGRYIELLEELLGKRG